VRNSFTDKKIKFEDICTLNKKMGRIQKCQTGMSPLDFIYELESNSYNLNQYSSDLDLLDKVQTGKGDDRIFKGFQYIFVNFVFGSTSPE
jgi:hypothetical protein